MQSYLTYIRKYRKLYKRKRLEITNLVCTLSMASENARKAEFKFAHSSLNPCKNIQQLHDEYTHIEAIYKQIYM